MKKLMIAVAIFVIIFCNTVMADEPSLIVRQEGTAQFELFSPGGVRILMDVCRPDILSTPANKDDILLSTHLHQDNFKMKFTESFPGKQLYACSGEIKDRDVYIQGIPSSHRATEPFSLGTNHIFIIEVAGLRVANLGGIGQSHLTDEQLKALGKIDILIAPIWDDFVPMDMVNPYAFTIIDQINPRLIIPTLADVETSRYSVKKWQGYYWDQQDFKISLSRLPDKQQIIFMGPAAREFRNICRVPKAQY
ncbi:MAG TPA: MBL fold metallo-hydrolase [Bacillota bacterium]|nr:MBL fold metallo-hydrolase [Bacillota bacterium]